MNDWYTMTLMAQEHCNDVLREALTEQMLREAFRGERARHSVRCRLLCKLGRWLAMIGAHLVEAYGAADAPPLHHAPPRPA